MKNLIHIVVYDGDLEIVRLAALPCALVTALFPLTNGKMRVCQWEAPDAGERVEMIAASFEEAGLRVRRTELTQ